MPKSTTEDLTRSSEKRPRSTSRTTNVPLHFTVHKPGCHIESCCGVCNLFPGVLLIAFCQVLVGSILLTLILTHGKQYDEMHQTPNSQYIRGVCNLFPGVLLIAFCQVLLGSILLSLILTHGKQYDEMHQTPTSQCKFFACFAIERPPSWKFAMCYLVYLLLIIACCQVRLGSLQLTLTLTLGKQYDEMHQTPTSQFMSLATGAILSGVTGAGLLLIIVALTENCRAMLVYLLVASLVWVAIVSLAVTKISRACVRFQDAPKIKDEQHRLANLACVSGLCTLFGAVIYFFSFMVVFSFYHFRYVRRAILLHEAECE